MKCKRVNEMAFDPGQHRNVVNPQRKQWIESGGGDLSKILPDLSDAEQTYIEMVTSAAYQQLLNRFKHYTKQDPSSINLPQLVTSVQSALHQLSIIEKDHKERLEQICVDTVLNLPEYTMVKEAYHNDEVRLDVQLGPAELQLTMPEGDDENNLQPEEQLNEELFEELVDADDPRVLRRRFANLLIQGNASLKFYLFNLVTKDLQKINPSLPELYGIVSTLVQLGQWMMPPGIEELAAQTPEAQMGSEEVIPQDDKYTIKVRAICFPYLLHELVKGIDEWASLSEDQKEGMKQDSFTKETEDMLVGPGVVQTIAAYLPADKLYLLPLVKKKVIALSRDEVKSVLKHTPEGEEIMETIIDESEYDWDTYKKQSEPQEPEEEPGSEYDPDLDYDIEDEYRKDPYDPDN